MRKRDALKIALRSMRFPKLNESDKLFYAGLTILSTPGLSSSFLAIMTKDALWFLIFAVGFMIHLWFAKAAQIMDEWEWKMKLKRALEEVEEE